MIDKIPIYEVVDLLNRVYCLEGEIQRLIIWLSRIHQPLRDAVEIKNAMTWAIRLHEDLGRFQRELLTQKEVEGKKDEKICSDKTH